MELYIKNNVSDITYLPELTPHPVYWVWGLIRTITYSHLRVRKLCAHLKCLKIST